MYYVGFSTATVVASLILFQGFNTTDASDTLSLLCGFIVTFLGVYLLNLSRKPEPPLDHNGHSALEGGLMNPRLSLQGRPSLEGWNDAHIGPAPSPGGHGRRSSLYRNQTTTLFNAFEEHEPGAPDSMGLQRLREEDESESDDENILNADERTLLQKTSPKALQSGSRSHNNSPILTRPPS
jgi:magnesium transporter